MALRIWILSLSCLISVGAAAQEFAYVAPSLQGVDYEGYMDQRSIPGVTLERVCSGLGGECRYNVVDHRGRIIKGFGGSDSLTRLGAGRYREVGYLLLSRGYPCGEEWCSENLLIDSRGQIRKIGELPWQQALALQVGAGGELYAVTEQAFVSRSAEGRSQTLAAPEALLSATIGANPGGLLSAVAVARSGRLYWSDGRQWRPLGFSLTAFGDRKGVAAVYPWRDDAHYIALYRYINEYNKGLYSIRFNPQDGTEEGGWLFNSEERNVGFDPDIYRLQDGRVVISATNSSAESRAFFQLDEGDFSQMNPEAPAHLQGSGFEREKVAAFMVGAGISRIAWRASSSVEQDNVTYTDVDYLIADSLFTQINLEGRIGTTSLTINYLQNRAEELVADEIDASGQSSSRALSQAASSYLFSTIDFQGLLSPSSVLRIAAEIGETNGVAEIRQLGGSVAYRRFSTKVRRIALLSMQERGFFVGGDYVDYRMPSAVGFSDASKQIAYSGFDPDFGFRAIRFVAGYDALAYAKRYETDYHRPYLAGGGNIGLGWADISAEIENAALAATGESEIDTVPIYFTAGLDLEGGYLWQQRFKRARGLGYSLALGYRLNFSILGGGQSEESEPDEGTLYLEFNRSDLMHGPFLKGNIIF